MAGDWLKMRHDLADDPATIRLAACCRLDEDAVIGKLFRLWSWADRHTQEGKADGVGLEWVDRTVRCPGFAAEMVRVGWLEETGQGLTFPRFDRHCSDSAKARALKKNRMERSRGAPSATEAPQKSRSCGAARATKAPPEERRGEVEIPPPPHACEEVELDMARWATLRDAWKAGPGAPHRSPDPPDEAVSRLAEPGWLDDALAAIGRLAGCRYFRTPVSLPQFCGPRFVKRVLQGRYDELTERKTGFRPAADDRKPAAAAAADWAKGASDPETIRKREEYLAAKAAKAARASGDDIEAAKAAMIATLRAAGG
jgi:hypothetical protein